MQQNVAGHIVDYACLPQHAVVTCNTFDITRKKAFCSKLLETHGAHMYKTLLSFKAIIWFHSATVLKNTYPKPMSGISAPFESFAALNQEQ